MLCSLRGAASEAAASLPARGRSEPLAQAEHVVARPACHLPSVSHPEQSFNLQRFLSASELFVLPIWKLIKPDRGKFSDSFSAFIGNHGRNSIERKNTIQPQQQRERGEAGFSRHAAQDLYLTITTALFWAP